MARVITKSFKKELPRHLLRMFRRQYLAAPPGPVRDEIAKGIAQMKALILKQKAKDLLRKKGVPNEVL